MTSQDIDDLFAATLLGGYDDDAPLGAVEELRRNGNHAIFEKAAEWCRSPEPLKRARGANVLSQLRAPVPPNTEPHLAEPIFVDESFNILSDSIESETDELALMSELFALGHLYKQEAIPILARYFTHNSDEVRFAVACSLGHFPNDPFVLELLMKLAEDSDQDVRNWSLFALGSQSDADSPELREIFVNHLDDPFQDAREEAIAGLAKRKDNRAVLPLFKLMQSGSYFSHHEYDFRSLIEAADDADLGTEDYIDALYARFPDLLPPIEEQSSN
jgi:hypothetical protein